MTIRTLYIRNFLSIEEAAVDLDDCTIFVGQNGAGKSNAVHALALLSEAAKVPLPSILGDRGGLDYLAHRAPGDDAAGGKTNGRSQRLPLLLGARFGSLSEGVAEGRYAFSIGRVGRNEPYVSREQCVVRQIDGSQFWFDRTAQSFRTNLGEIVPSHDPGSLVLPLIGGDARLNPVVKALSAVREYSIQPLAVARGQDSHARGELQSNGANAVGALREIRERSPEDYERLLEFLAAIVPGISDVVAVEELQSLSLEFVQRWEGSHSLRLPAVMMSEGTLRAVGLLAALFQTPAPSVIAIEEPEASLHPGALAVMMDVIRVATKRTQVIITTQSPEVLDAEWIDDRSIRVVEWEKGRTRIASLATSSRAALREHLMGAGALLRAGALRSEPMLAASAGEIYAEVP